MELTEMIIKAHVTVHAAELAIKTESRDAAFNEMAKLRELLEKQPELEAGGG